MKRLVSLTLLMLVVCSLPLAGVAEDGGALPASVQNILEGHGLGHNGLSVVVHAVDADRPLLSLNPGVPRSPASTIKLLTTFAALDLLGPAYTWQTEAWIAGQLVNGRLEGDLVLKGGGDPYLTTERFWTFLRELSAKGLRQIDGDLIIDNSYFEPEPEDPGAFDGQPWRTYNVTPDALLVNLKAVQFRVYRPVAGGSPRVMTDPVLANLEIDNRIGSVKGPCQGFQRGVAIDLPEGLDGNTVQLSGRFPTGCHEYSIYRTVMTPPEFAYGVFEPLWTQLGGNLSGHVTTGVVPDDAKRFARFNSIPMAEVVRNVNKFSNNVMTRQLLLTMGAEKMSEPGTAAKGRLVIDRWLADMGLDHADLYVENGSGLSRETRMPAGVMADMLLAAWRHPYMAEFIASMPLSGLDGTMRNRFRGSSLAGRMHVKTGRLDDVYAIAGYVQARSGTRYVVVEFHNDKDVHRGPGKELQDRLLRWVYEQ
ncbi:MAG: D-alanyl-D-alanine carboxypeptidase/D-alanyl-D-alanine-endopeptidase [Gammaproteobacteria bacterium]|nr:MAG: D-alanyl-D-alanine carboxypeptidase/D-alanyl-D-alanine-endopeptidase [Gammaproteobacteria bacterium]